MHQLRLHHCLTVVQNMNLLNRHVTLVHIIEQQFCLVSKHIAEGVRIRSFEIAFLLNHDTSDSQQQRLVGGIAIDAYLLLEMSHCLGIVNGAHRESLTRSNSSQGIRDGGAATRGLYIINKQWLVTTILHLKLRLDGVSELYLPTVDSV